MKLSLKTVLPALGLFAGMIGVCADARAVSYFMTPAASGLPASSTKSYYVESTGGVYTFDGGGMAWVVPTINYTAMSSGGSSYIDLGACSGSSSGQGIASDDLGNTEAVTGVVYANHSYATSQFVSFGTGFLKTSYTYVDYFLSLDYLCIGNGVEYQQY
jgi:hypothetical protein